MSRLSIYERWENEGSFDERLATIKELVSRRIPQKDIAKVLGISERVLIKLKKEHPSIKNAFIFGDKRLKDSLVNAIYEKAVGMETEDVKTEVEENNGKRKSKITKYKKTHTPDFHSARYLLITKFGIDYNERKDEIEIMQKRAESKDEVWK